MKNKMNEQMDQRVLKLLITNKDGLTIEDANKALMKMNWTYDSNDRGDYTLADFIEDEEELKEYLGTQTEIYVMMASTFRGRPYLTETDDEEHLGYYDFDTYVELCINE